MGGSHGIINFSHFASTAGALALASGTAAGAWKLKVSILGPSNSSDTDRDLERREDIQDPEDSDLDLNDEYRADELVTGDGERKPGALTGSGWRAWDTDGRERGKNMPKESDYVPSTYMGQENTEDSAFQRAFRNLLGTSSSSGHNSHHHSGGGIKDGW